MMAGCYAEGATIRAFAEKCGEAASRIYKRVNRVRRQLHHCIDRQLGLRESTQ